MDNIPDKVNQIKKICFRISGTPPPKMAPLTSLSFGFNKWLDFNKQYVFPIHIALTLLCPGSFIYSPSLRQTNIIELTYPFEENMERWHSVKYHK